MTEVVSVRFKPGGKSYYFDPCGVRLNTGDSAIVETAKGLEYGECTRGNYMVGDDKIIPPLRAVVRIATADDQKARTQNREKEAKAMRICSEKIIEHGLDMKLVDVEYNFEGSKILFFFTSDGRVDFRELVKDLASVFRTRIELRQIGVRDEAKMLGGLGICGKPFCCSQFLDEFQPVSIKMAKTQNLSLNPTKISGTCGRLMCCLKYEQEAYESLVKNAPRLDSYVETPMGNGTITDVNLLRQRVKVRMDSRGGDPSFETLSMDEVTFIKTGKQRRAEVAAETAVNGNGTEQPHPGTMRRPRKPPVSADSASGKPPVPQKREPKAVKEKAGAEGQKQHSGNSGGNHRRRKPKAPQGDGGGTPKSE